MPPLGSYVQPGSQSTYLHCFTDSIVACSSSGYVSWLTTLCARHSTGLYSWNLRCPCMPATVLYWHHDAASVVDTTFHPQWPVVLSGFSMEQFGTSDKIHQLDAAVSARDQSISSDCRFSTDWKSLLHAINCRHLWTWTFMFLFICVKWPCNVNDVSL